VEKGSMVSRRRAICEKHCLPTEQAGIAQIVLGFAIPISPLLSIDYKIFASGCPFGLASWLLISRPYAAVFEPPWLSES
jgi:hypothetical protein